MRYRTERCGWPRTPIPPGPPNPASPRCGHHGRCRGDDPAGQVPEVAGKPEPALLAETLERVGSDRAVFVGDRLDTDIAGAHSVSIPGVLVLTGSHGKADLVAAPPAQRPAQVIADLGGLFAPAREAVGDHHRVQVNAVTAVIDGDTVTLDGPLEGTAEQLDALWALLSLVWARTDAGLPVPDTDRMLAGLDQVH